MFGDPSKWLPETRQILLHSFRFSLKHYFFGLLFTAVWKTEEPTEPTVFVRGCQVVPRRYCHGNKLTSELFRGLIPFFFIGQIRIGTFSGVAVFVLTLTPDLVPRAFSLAWERPWERGWLTPVVPQTWLQLNNPTEIILVNIFTPNHRADFLWFCVL